MRPDFRWSKTLAFFTRHSLVVQLVTFSPLWHHLQNHVRSFTAVLKPSPGTLNTLARFPSDYLKARFVNLKHQHLASIQMLAFGYYKNKCFAFFLHASNHC